MISPENAQNLLRLLRSVDERSVKLGLEIHQHHPTPESTALLDDYQQLYTSVFSEDIDTLVPKHLVELNQPALDLSGLEIDRLPKEIVQLTQLQMLNLNENNLTQLPPEVSALVHLQELMLYENSLNELPTEIAQLKQLQILDIGFNDLTKLPAEIGQLNTLKELYLGENNLSELPTEIAQLKQLQILDLSFNELDEEFYEKLPLWLPNCDIQWE